MMTLGRLCVRQQLWAKAQSYLEAAMSIEDTPAVRLALASLAEQLDRQGEADRHYRAAAQLSVSA